MSTENIFSNTFAEVFPDAFQRDPYAVITGKLEVIVTLIREIENDLEVIRNKGGA